MKFRKHLLLVSLVLLGGCDIAPDAPVLDGNKPPIEKNEPAPEPLSQAALESRENKNAEEKRPNILLIVADDLGYFDIGAYGGEIETPNLDALAERGIRFRQLRTAPVCAPSRAMLLTGADNHLVGIGSQFPRGAQIGAPGYEGYLSPQAVTLAEVLRDAGYYTFMAGKWHLGLEQEHSPAARGFDSSFSMVMGAAGHFDMTGPGPGEGVKALYRENGKLVEQLPDGFYSTDYYTDRIISDIEQSLTDKKPFFGYVAYTSPHWPLQAPDEYLEKYKGRYDAGYEAVCHSRFERAKTRNVIPSNATFSGCRSVSRPWDTLSDEEKHQEARLMEIYAAMVDNLDHNVGRIIEYLESTDELENTFILFMSDNGADERRREQLPGVNEWIAENFDNSFDNLGRAGSFVSYGKSWASVSMSPLKDHKGTMSDGGIRVPAIVAYSKIGRGGQWFDEAITNRDIAPTLYALAEVARPASSGVPVQGKSLLDQLLDPQGSVHAEGEVFAWETEGSKAVLQDGWKLVRNIGPNSDTGWMLFNLNEDPFEATDLSEQLPQKTTEMIALFTEYEQEVGVVYSGRQLQAE